MVGGESELAFGVLTFLPICLRALFHDCVLTLKVFSRPDLCAQILTQRSKDLMHIPTTNSLKLNSSSSGQYTSSSTGVSHFPLGRHPRPPSSASHPVNKAIFSEYLTSRLKQAICIGPRTHCVHVAKGLSYSFRSPSRQCPISQFQNHSRASNRTRLLISLREH